MVLAGPCSPVAAAWCGPVRGQINPSLRFPSPSWRSVLAALGISSPPSLAPAFPWWCCSGRGCGTRPGAWGPTGESGKASRVPGLRLSPPAPPWGVRGYGGSGLGRAEEVSLTRNFCLAELRPLVQGERQVGGRLLLPAVQGEPKEEWSWGCAGTQPCPQHLPLPGIWESRSGTLAWTRQGGEGAALSLCVTLSPCPAGGESEGAAG